MDSQSHFAFVERVMNYTPPLLLLWLCCGEAPAFVPPTVSCAVNTPCLFTNRASFELVERNRFLKSPFDGEPNLFSPLKSLLQRSETRADVSGGARPERRAAVPRYSKLAVPASAHCVGKLVLCDERETRNKWSKWGFKNPLSL